MKNKNAKIDQLILNLREKLTEVPLATFEIENRLILTELY